MTTTKEYIAQAMEAILSGDSDRALGLQLRASLAYDDDISKVEARFDEPLKAFHAGPPGTKDDLPPMTPIKGRVMPRQIKCPTCKAKVGQPCFRLSSRGPHGKPTDQPLETAEGKAMTHKSRSKAAKEASNG